MQDTSTNQYRLLELLTHGWDGRSQTVFLVGDPKQSIYLFRHARVERFMRTMLTGELGDLPLGRLQLTANFRSQGGLVSAFNADFSALFSRDPSIPSSEDLSYLKAVAVRKPTNNVKDIAWHATTLTSSPAGQQNNSHMREQAAHDARSIRAIIQQWRIRPLPPGRTTAWKIAVLARTKNLLHDIIEELKTAAIPYRAVDIEPLAERQEVLDLFALTRALLHPADRTAWLAILRAPWCGLSLTELHILAGADGPDYFQRSIYDLIVERGDLLSEAGCERLTRFWPVMHSAVDKRSLLPTSQLVERTWRSLGGDVYLSPEGTANAHRYLQLLADLESKAGIIDLSLLQHHMEGLFANSSTTDGAVDLLTIHKAKGLEWDVVIVPRLEKSPRRSRGQLLAWEELDMTGDSSASFVLAPITGKGEGSKTLNAWIRRIHTAREMAEQKRLFYVACTRGKEELHLFAAAKMNSKGETTPASGSLLDTTWPVAYKHFSVTPVVLRESQKTSSASISEAAGFVSDMAASDEATPQARLQRLPLQFHPPVPLDTTSQPFASNARYPSDTSHTSSEAPSEARAFGNAVHAFLESLARHVASGMDLDQLRKEITTWNPRMIAVLRSEGLTLRQAGEYAQQVKTALDNTLQNTEGRWILTSHKDSSSELALTAWQENRTNIRIDRIFKAGPEPLVEGDSYLWIVDYKTASCRAECMEEFLTGERARYEPQLTSYARIAGSGHPAAEIRLGLYFPMLPKFIWWKPELSLVNRPEPERDCDEHLRHAPRK